MKAGNKPSLMPRLLRLLEDGIPRHDRELVDLIYCERRSVQRLLVELHRNGLVHIAAWAKAGESYRYRPCYKLGAGKDKPAPPLTARSATQRVHRFRERESKDDAEFNRQRRNQLARVVKRDPMTAMFFGSGAKKS